MVTRNPPFLRSSMSQILSESTFSNTSRNSLVPTRRAAFSSASSRTFLNSCEKNQVSRMAIGISNDKASARRLFSTTCSSNRELRLPRELKENIKPSFEWIVRTVERHSSIPSVRNVGKDLVESIIDLRECSHEIVQLPLLQFVHEVQNGQFLSF